MRPAEFKWGALSNRQKMILTWWLPESPMSKKNGIIADGAIRSGKTTAMAFSFCLWAMETFNGQNFAICGKTVGSVRRNVVTVLKRQLTARGYQVTDHHSDNVLMVTRGLKSNAFYLFGGKDESSQDLIQGITLAGAFFDEVALMPQSFVNQATARCSVTGSKFWFNCNPSSPQHWFYINWITKTKERDLMYLHFTMADNLTLSPDIVARYESQYAGVFYQRYILGRWVMADGIIYDMFDSNVHILPKDARIECEDDYYISSDFGVQNATVFLLWGRERNTQRWVCLNEWYYSGRDTKVQKTVQEMVDGLESIIPPGINIKQVIIDPSAAALIAEVRKRGFHTRKADNDVLNGISNVSTMLRQDKLVFMPRCKNTIDEFGVYAWDTKATDRGIDQPIKANDHCLDAVRYFVKTLRLVRKFDRYDDED